MSTTPEMLKSRDQFWSAVQRIHETNSGITYHNEDSTFKLMIRNDPDGGAGKFMVLDLIIVAPEEEERVIEALEMENDGWWDEDDPTAFVVESWEFLKKDPDEDEIKEMMDYVNATYKYKICPCAKYFIKDGKDMCVFCELTASQDDLKKESCPICLSDGYTMHMKKTKCCSQTVHKDCAKTWSLKGNTDKCALCRATNDDAPSRQPRGGTDRLVLQIDEGMLENIVERITTLAAAAGQADESPAETASESESSE